MKTSSIFSLVIITLSLAHSNLAFAQNDKATEEEIEFASSLLGTSFEALKENGPKKYQNELNSITFKLVRSLDPLIMHATLGDKKEIEISVGAVILLSNLAYASAASVFIDDGSKKMNDWLREVAKKIDSKNYIYNDFLTFSDAEEPNQEWFPAILQGKLYAGVSYVVAHECAHILLGHTSASSKNMSSDKIQLLEYEADSLSVDLITPLAGGNGTLYSFYSSGYIPLFLFSMSMNFDVLGFESMREHPPETMRAVELAGAFYQKAFKYISNEQHLKIIESDYNNRILELKLYDQIIQYRSYINDPNNEVISLEEWKKLKSGDIKN